MYIQSDSSSALEKSDLESLPGILNDSDLCAPNFLVDGPSGSLSASGVTD